MKDFQKNMLVSAVAASMLLGASVVSANLITNGGFEDPFVKPGEWDFFDSSKVDGWDGSNIEIWNDFGGVSAYEGEQFAELNSHPDSGNYGRFTLYQEFATSIGQWYDFSFAHRARNDSDADPDAEESFWYEIGSAFNPAEWWLRDDSQAELIKNNNTSDWSVFEGRFQADSELSQITFLSQSPEGTEGNFLDDVNVVASVPEPGSLALLGLGLAGLGLSRRRQQK